MTSTFDVGIVGSGFAGSLFALVARRLGLSVVLLEKGTHPRFTIGESTTPLTNLLFESLAIRYRLPRLLPLTKWGRWQAAYPEIGAGLKRGFTFFAHEAGRPFANRGDGSDRLLVPASPRDEIADTHWYRRDFDQFLVKEAEAEGVDYRDRFTLEGVCRNGDAWEIEGSRHEARAALTARFLVDASGRNTALAQALGAPLASPSGMPRTQALFSHFAGVRRLDTMPEFRSASVSPYPLDDAAVHHVFEGGWIWVLRFANGITSAGIAATETLARELDLEAGEPAWRRVLDRFPAIRAQFAGARALRGFDHSPALAFRRARAAGPGWALLPSAAAFADPLLSSGFPLTLLGIDRLARALAEDFGTPRFDSRLAEYETVTLAEADRTAAFVGSLYTVLGDFPRFVERTSLYFRFAESVEAIARANPSGDFSRSIAFLDLPELAGVSAPSATFSAPA